MGYDITFEDNRKEWYNIWHMELFSLFHAYALRRLELKEFKKRVFSLGLGKNQSQGNNNPELENVWDEMEHDEETGKPKVNFTMWFDKIPISEFDIMKHLLKGKEIEGYVYAVRIEPPEAIEQLLDEDGKLPQEFEDNLLAPIGHYERMEEYRKIINCPVFSKYSINNGHTITSKEAEDLVNPFMIMTITTTEKEKESMMNPVAEVFGTSEINHVLTMFAHIAYSMGSGYSFTVT